MIVRNFMFVCFLSLCFFPFQVDAGKTLDLKSAIYKIPFGFRSDSNGTSFSLDDLKKVIKKKLNGKSSGASLLIYSNSILCITDTPANIAAFEKILPEYVNPAPPQFFIDFMSVRIPEHILEKCLGKRNILANVKLNLQQLNKVLLSDGVEVISSSGLMVLDGREANLSCMLEKYFPETYNPQQSLIIGETMSNPASLQVKAKKTEVPAEIEDMMHSGDAPLTPEEDELDDDPSMFDGGGAATGSGVKSVAVGNANDELSALKIELQKGDVVKSRVVPGFGAPTELGGRMRVSAKFRPGKNDVLLEISPVEQVFYGWTCDCPDKEVKFPVIGANSFDCNIKLKKNGIVLMASDGRGHIAKQTSQESELTHNFFIVRCQRVSPSGQILSFNKQNPGFERIYLGEPLISSSRKPEDYDDLDYALSQFIGKKQLISKEQVNVKTTFLEISKKDFAKLAGRAAMSGLPSAELLDKIVSSGKTKLIAFPNILTKSGEEGSYRSVRETLFPGCYADVEMWSRGNVLFVSEPYPEYGEGTDLGVKLLVTPREIIDGLIQLALITQESEGQFSVYSTGWSVFRNGKCLKEKKYSLKMPLIKRVKLSNTLHVKEGAMLCVGKSSYTIPAERKGDSESVLVFIIASADIEE